MQINILCAFIIYRLSLLGKWMKNIEDFNYYLTLLNHIKSCFQSVPFFLS